MSSFFEQPYRCLFLSNKQITTCKITLGSCIASDSRCNKPFNGLLVILILSVPSIIVAETKFIESYSSYSSY